MPLYIKLSKSGDFSGTLYHPFSRDLIAWFSYAILVTEEGCLIGDSVRNSLFTIRYLVTGVTPESLDSFEVKVSP